jgi:hypothetical protein
MRTATDIEPIALPIDGDRLALGDDVLDDLDLVLLAELAEDLLGLLAIPDLAHDREIAFDDLVHARLDRSRSSGVKGSSRAKS